MSVKELKMNSYLDIAKCIDIKSTDTLLLASDIKKIALTCKEKNIKFDADLFIDSFKEVLKEGNLLIPAYTDYLKNNDTFDYLLSKPSTGALSNKVMKREDFLRTEEPIHSVFIWGKDKDEFLNLKPKSTFGKDSLFEKLHTKKAKMLIIDVDLQNSFTFVHYIEESIGVKYRRNFNLSFNYIDQNKALEKRNIIFQTKRKGIETYLFGLEEYLKKTITKCYKFNNSEFQLIELDKGFDSVVEYIKNGNKLYRYSLKKHLIQVIKKIIGKKEPIF